MGTKWLEEDFWAVYQDKESQDDIMIVDEVAAVDNSQDACIKESFIKGVSNKPLLLNRRTNVQTQKVDYTLTSQDCKRLLLEYPRLREAYELYVSIEKLDKHQFESNEEFWSKFLMKNLEF